MSRQRLWASILIFVAVVGAVFVDDMVRSRTPVLGLDLQGGLSVIYAAKDPADQSDLLLVRDQMREQLEALRIAEPDVRLEGQNIVADLPGVSDQEAAKNALDVSGIVTLRPVLSCQVVAPNPQVITGSTVAGSTEAPLGFRKPPTVAATPDTTPDVTTPAGTEVPTVPPVTLAPGAIFSGTTTTLPQSSQLPDGAQVLLSPGSGEQCMVGPAGGSGEVFQKQGSNAEIDQYGRWVVNADLKREGEAQWNELASQCFSAAATCPSRRLAIVLDDVIQSAPTVNAPSFTGSVQISGAFEQAEAERLAGVINRGAYPVEVVVQRTETVSPTAGKDSLRAAIWAGLIGIAIMLAFMILYYRKLAIIMIIGLSIWGVTVFTLATYVSRATNYALTLAGATGIIIAVGVTVDTYVVFFERIRDERRAGRTFANAAPRSYRLTGRTVLSADIVSLIASLILFSLSVGSVQGFALYLGLTTVCDLLVFYFFTRPAVLLLSQTRWGRSSGLTKAVVGASA